MDSNAGNALRACSKETDNNPAFSPRAEGKCRTVTASFQSKPSLIMLHEFTSQA